MYELSDAHGAKGGPSDWKFSTNELNKHAMGLL